MQSDYVDQSAYPALEGGLYDSGPYDVVSRSPGGNVKQVQTITATTCVVAVAQVSTLTVGTAADADAYTIEIGEFRFTGTSAGTDATVQATAIRAQLNADTDFTALYSVGGTGADVVITALRVGVFFATYVTITATSVWTWAETTANVVGTQFNVTVDGHQVVYPAGSTTPATEIDALQAALEADPYIPALVDFAQPTTTTLTLTAKTAGVPFTYAFSNENVIGDTGSGDITSADTTANVTGNPVPFGRALVPAGAGLAALPSVAFTVLDGVSVNRAKGLPKDTTVSPPVTGEAQYLEDEAVPTMRWGRVWVRVEEAVTAGGAVRIRHTQGANPEHTVGRFRTTAVAGETVLVSAGARWITSASSGDLSVLEFNSLTMTFSADT